MSCSFSFPESLPGQLTPYLALTICQTCGRCPRPPGQDPTVYTAAYLSFLATPFKCSKGLCPGNGERNTYPSAEGGRNNPLWGHCPGPWPPSNSESTHRESLGECHWCTPIGDDTKCIIPSYLKCVLFSDVLWTSMPTMESILRLKISGVLQLCWEEKTPHSKC